MVRVRPATQISPSVSVSVAGVAALGSAHVPQGATQGSTYSVHLRGAHDARRSSLSGHFAPRPAGCHPPLPGPALRTTNLPSGGSAGSQVSHKWNPASLCSFVTNNTFLSSFGASKDQMR